MIQLVMMAVELRSLPKPLVATPPAYHWRRLADIRALTVLSVKFSVQPLLLSMPPPRARHPVPWAVAPASALIAGDRAAGNV